MGNDDYEGTSILIGGSDGDDRPKLVYGDKAVNWIIDNLPKQEPKINGNGRILTCSTYAWDLVEKIYKPVPFIKIETKPLKVNLLKEFERKRKFHANLEENFPIMYHIFKNYAEDIVKESMRVSEEYSGIKTKIAIEHNRLREESKKIKEDMLNKAKERFKKEIHREQTEVEIKLLDKEISDEEKKKMEEKVERIKKEMSAYKRTIDNLFYFFIGDLIIGREEEKCDIVLKDEEYLSGQQGLLALRNGHLVYIDFGINSSLPVIFKGENIIDLEAKINGEGIIINRDDPNYQVAYFLLGMDSIPKRGEEFTIPRSYFVLEYPN